MHDNFFANWMLGPLIILAFVLWCWHEDAWQAKLDNALANCLTPMTDGSGLAGRGTLRRCGGATKRSPTPLCPLSVRHPAHTRSIRNDVIGGTDMQ